MIGRGLRKLFNAERAPSILWEPEVHGSLSVTRPYFETRIRNAISNIPLELQDKFSRAGHKIVICRHLSDIKNPERLFPKTAEFLNGKNISFEDGFAEHGGSGGIYLNFDGDIAIPQLPDDYYINLPVSRWFGHDAEFIVAHEIGHLFDDNEIAPRKLYLNPEFLETCRQELADLPSVAVLINKIPNGAYIVEFFGSDNQQAIGFREIYANLFAENVLKRGNTRLLLPKTAKVVEDDINNAVNEYRATFIPNSTEFEINHPEAA